MPERSLPLRKLPFLKKTVLKGVCVSVVGFLLTPDPVRAFQTEVAEKTISTIGECRSIEQDPVRLVCYDTVSDGGIFTLKERRKAVAEQFGKADVRKEKPEKSAKVQDDTDEQEDADSLEVEVVAVKKSKLGRLFFYTGDGQVWRQLGSEFIPKEATPYKAILKKGPIGSYSLVSVKLPKAVKVKRVK